MSIRKLLRRTHPIVRVFLLIMVLAALPLTLSRTSLPQANADTQPVIIIPVQTCGANHGGPVPPRCIYQQHIPGNACTGGTFVVNFQDLGNGDQLYYEVVIQANGDFFLADWHGNPVGPGVHDGARVIPDPGCELVVFNPLTGQFVPAASDYLSGGLTYALIPIPTQAPTATPTPGGPPPTGTPVPPTSTPRPTATTGPGPRPLCKILTLNQRLRKPLCKLILVLNRLNHLPIIVIVLPNGFLEFRATNTNQHQGTVDIVVTNPQDILVRINKNGSFTAVNGINLNVTLDGHPHFAVVSRLKLSYSATSNGKSVMVGEGTFKNAPKGSKISVAVGGAITFSPKLTRAVQVTPLSGFVLQIQVSVKVKGKTTLVWQNAKNNTIPAGASARFVTAPGR